uniref:Uncharacterized protein n=1 Tax=Mycena chlorophos TaxID=658473 RepID=A0ABQ0LFJ9_MYCCL|nr:predicted protein [Mycena chlorophos]
MPYVEDHPSSPASTIPAYLRASLRGLSAPAYLAFGVVIIGLGVAVYYVAYNIYHKITLDEHIPTSYKQSTKKKGSWRGKGFRHKPADSETRCLVQHKPSEPSFVQLPVPVRIVSHKCPLYDTHNIRFASPSANFALFSNPKLAPVVGSAIPLSYDSRENLFPNLFAPVAAQEQQHSISQRTLQRLKSIKAVLKNVPRRKSDKENNLNFTMLSGNGQEWT